VVFREGEPGGTMFFIVSGRVALLRQPEGGETSVLGHLSAGDFFGELALLTGAPRTATVMAVERTVLLELSESSLEVGGARYGMDGTVVRLASRERLLADALRTSPLLASLPPEVWLQLGSAFTPHTAGPGDELLTRHRPGDALYLLLRGRCAAFHTDEEGRQQAYPALEEGSLFGEISLLRGHLATATVRALTPCTLLRLERGTFERYLKSQPALRGALVRLGLQRLKRTLRVMNAPA
jgi:cAMP-dependent protein kinase regulator